MRVVAAGLIALAMVAPLGIALASPDDGNPLPLYLQAIERREVGDADGAIADLEAARALAPDDPDLALELARSYAAARRWGDAAAAYEEASVLAPARADLALAQARFHLAHAFRVAIALQAAEHAARLAPDDPDVVTALDQARTAVALATD